MKQKKIKEALKSLDFLILAIKSTGGYKFRQRIRASEKEIEEYLIKAVPELKIALVSLLVAEEILQEPGYWDRTPRWAEYIERRDEAMKAVNI